MRNKDGANLKVPRLSLSEGQFSSRLGASALKIVWDGSIGRGAGIAVLSWFTIGAPESAGGKA